MERKKYSPTVFDLLTQYRALLEHDFSGSFAAAIAMHREPLLEKIQAVENALRESGYESCKKYPVHYDVSACNVLWEKGKIVSLIDFDWVQEATLEFDFARSVMETCGGYIEGGSPDNLLDAEKFQIACGAYNAAAKVPLNDRGLMQSVIDAGSLFLAFWGIRTFLEVGNNEPYFLGFFRAGLERLEHPVKFA